MYMPDLIDEELVARAIAARQAAEAAEAADPNFAHGTRSPHWGFEDSMRHSAAIAQGIRRTQAANTWVAQVYCDSCDQELLPSYRGQRRYCSNACRQKAYWLGVSAHARGGS